MGKEYTLKASVKKALKLVFGSFEEAEKELKILQDNERQQLSDPNQLSTVGLQHLVALKLSEKLTANPQTITPEWTHHWIALVNILKKEGFSLYRKDSTDLSFYDYFTTLIIGVEIENETIKRQLHDFAESLAPKSDAETEAMLIKAFKVQPEPVSEMQSQSLPDSDAQSFSLPNPEAQSSLSPDLEILLRPFLKDVPRKKRKSKEPSDETPTQKRRRAMDPASRKKPIRGKEALEKNYKMYLHILKTMVERGDKYDCNELRPKYRDIALQEGQIESARYYHILNLQKSPYLDTFMPLRDRKSNSGRNILAEYRPNIAELFNIVGESKEKLFQTYIDLKLQLEALENPQQPEVDRKKLYGLLKRPTRFNNIDMVDPNNYSFMDESTLFYFTVRGLSRSENNYIDTKAIIAEILNEFPFFKKNKNIEAALSKKISLFLSQDKKHFKLFSVTPASGNSPAIVSLSDYFYDKQSAGEQEVSQSKINFKKVLAAQHLLEEFNNKLFYLENLFNECIRMKHAISPNHEQAFNQELEITSAKPAVAEIVTTEFCPPEILQSLAEPIYTINSTEMLPLASHFDETTRTYMDEPVQRSFNNQNIGDVAQAPWEPLTNAYSAARIQTLFGRSPPSEKDVQLPTFEPKEFTNILK